STLAQHRDELFFVQHLDAELLRLGQLRPAPLASHQPRRLGADGARRLTTKGSNQLRSLLAAEALERAREDEGLTSERGALLFPADGLLGLGHEARRLEQRGEGLDIGWLAEVAEGLLRPA